MKRLISGIGVALLVAACGTTSSPSPAGSAAGASASAPASSAAASPSASDVESASPSSSASASTSAGPSASGSAVAAPHVDPELEARLPSVVNGITLEKASMAANDFMGGDGMEEFQALLQATGAQAEDVTIGVASSPDLSVAALRVAGAEAQSFLQNAVQAVVSENPGSTSTTVDIAGRQVVRVSASGGDSYFIAVGDTVYQVDTDDAAQAAAAIGLLPQS